MIKKNKIILFLFFSTCFLILLIILTSKVLTIRPGAMTEESNDIWAETVEGTEMEKVRTEYLFEIEQIAKRFEEYFERLDTMISSTSKDVIEIESQKEKIKNLQNDLTALLVPPEYRKKHLEQVLLFTKIESTGNNELELMSYLKLIGESFTEK